MSRPGEGVCGVGAAGPRSDLEAEELDAFEGDDEFGGPGPAGRDAESGASAGVGDLPGGVLQAVAQPFGFGASEVTIERCVAGPGEQVVGDEGGGEPGGVDRGCI